MKIIQHFPYPVTLPEIVDRQRRRWRWVQEQLKRKRNNVELIFVFKYKVNIGKLSNFVSTINWSKTLSKGITRTSLKTRTTMRTDCLSTGKFPHIISYTMRLALPFKYPKKLRNEERYSSETTILLKNLEQSHTLLSKNKREYLRRKYKSSRSSPKTHLSQEKTKWTTSALRE